jgi:hypothetical protein
MPHSGFGDTISPRSAPPPTRNRRGAARCPIDAAASFLQLRGERHAAGTTARAADGDEHALLVLLVDVHAIEHGSCLLLEQVVKRQIAQADLIVGRPIAGARLVVRQICRRRRRRPRRLPCAFGAAPQGEISSRTRHPGTVLPFTQSCLPNLTPPTDDPQPANSAAWVTELLRLRPAMMGKPAAGPPRPGWSRGGDACIVRVGL